ncbi:MAG: GNAT family N-acetyltransferase [Clostridia bacterium]|nr:GNAT family N-acetyltransferase [Clostridia bacterium]
MTDYTQHKQLYLLCFTEDTAEDAELIFEKVFSKAKMLSEYNELGQPIAMLYLMDAKIVDNGKKDDYYYLYAACTHPSYRGKGIMGRLLEKAKAEAVKDNKKGIFLKPANPPLFDFYAKSNFLPYFNVCKVCMESAELINRYPARGISTEASDLSEWYSLRQDLLKGLNQPFVEFSKDMLVAAADGGIAVKGKDFGFVYEIRDNLFLVKEALCEKGASEKLFQAISNLLSETNCEKVEIRLPPALIGELSSFDNPLKPFSVMWFTENGNTLKTNGHHGFAFD